MVDRLYHGLPTQQPATWLWVCCSASDGRRWRDNAVRYYPPPPTQIKAPWKTLWTSPSPLQSTLCLWTTGDIVLKSPSCGRVRRRDPGRLRGNRTAALILHPAQLNRGAACFTSLLYSLIVNAKQTCCTRLLVRFNCDFQILHYNSSWMNNVLL